VTEYTVQRVTYDAGLPGAVQTFAAPDLIPGDGMKVTFNDNTAAQPAVGRIYHYTVTASHCATAPQTSGPSTPDAKFPCAILTAAPTSDVIDGDGSAGNPWVNAEDTAAVTVTSNTDLLTATATVREYPAGAPSAPINGMTLNPRLADFSFSMPGSSSIFEITMQFTDVLGCGSTITRYFQESPTSCCILPHKDGSGVVFNAPTPVIVAGPLATQLTLTLQNQCDEVLTIDTLRFHWTVGTPAKDLVSITYPGNIVDTFGGVNDTVSPAILNPASVGASTTIPGNGSYRIVLTFSRSNGLTTDTVNNFCARYTRAGNLTVEDCQVVQPGVGLICP